MLSESELSPTLLTLFDNVVCSIEQLELLLRVRSDPQPHTVRELADALGLAPSVITPALEVLVRKRLVVVLEGQGAMRYAYQPQDPSLAASVDELARFCVERRVDVIMFISARAIERVRSNVRNLFSAALTRPLKRPPG